MTNPTSNFGWQMPTSSDLVTDLPADFEVFGQAVDTSLADLKGGTTGQVLAKASNTNMDFTWVAQDDSNAIQNAIVDAKGDLIAASAADTPARLAVGTNGQVLTADSTAATGLAWATPAAGQGFTLLSTTTLSTSSTTISGISQDYKHLVFYCKGITSSSTSPQSLNLRLNGDTGSNYSFVSIRSLGGTVLGSGGTDTGVQFVDRLQSTSTVSKLGSSQVWIYRYTDTNHHDFFINSYGNDGSQFLGQNVQGNYDCTAAITSATFYNTGGGNLGGTIYIYGVN
jgi:hypothetical protein